MTHSIRKPFATTTVAIACLAAATACSDPPPATVSGIVVRDSAGVEIVEHSADYIASLPQWTIDTVPLVHIAGDAPGNAFTNIRAVTQRTNGRFIVVEARAREIREYSATGVFERVVSRGGQGPGEIEYVGRLQLTPEDSLIVFDVNQRRASVFAPSGTFVRQVSYPRLSDGSRFAALGMLSDKRLIGTIKKAIGELVATDGPVTRVPYAIVRMDIASAANDSASFGAADTVAVVPDLEAYPTAFPSEGKSYPDIDFLIYGRRTNIAVADHAIFVGTNVTGEIEQYNEQGVIRKIRSAVVPAPVTEAHRAQVRAEITQGFDKARQPQEILTYLLTQRRIADVFAFHETLTPGRDSTLWVEAPRFPSEGGRKYLVYDAHGRAIARAQFPERIVPHSFSRTQMLGVWLDSDDVPHVMVWKIIIGKPTAQ